STFGLEEHLTRRKLQPRRLSAALPKTQGEHLAVGRPIRRANVLHHLPRGTTIQRHLREAACAVSPEINRSVAAYGYLPCPGDSQQPGGGQTEQTGRFRMSWVDSEELQWLPVPGCAIDYVSPGRAEPRSLNNAPAEGKASEVDSPCWWLPVEYATDP